MTHELDWNDMANWTSRDVELAADNEPVRFAAMVNEMAVCRGEGKWIVPTGTSGKFWRCSACEWRNLYGKKFDYCPNCGAAMDIEEDAQ